jgi:glycine oxidase
VTSSSIDVAVAGGGAIGLACAWRAAERGLRTVVLDAGDAGAWQVAAGMLAPVTEAEPGESALLELGLRSARAFEAFCAALEEPGYRTSGTLVVARDRDEAEALEHQLAFRRELGLEVERLRPSQARRVEPALAPTVRLALDVPNDHSVDPRRMIAALAGAFERAGGTLRRARVEALVTDGARVAGLRLAGGEVVRAERVVLAPGVGRVDVPDHARVPVRPVKGQVLRLRDPRGPGLVERTIRGAEAYLVPRADGGYVLGATMEERGYDTAPTAGGVYELLRDMSELVPGVLELEIEQVHAGLRPATPDNLPAIGRGALEGLVWATGHYRNGILLAPVTADLVAGVLCGEPVPDWAAPADPRRFARVPA